MDTRTPAKVFRGIVVGLATLALLVGCSGPGGDNSGGDSGAEPDRQSYTEDFSEEAPQDGAAEESAESNVAERAIITTTSAEIRVDDVPGSVEQLEQLVSKYDGRVEARTERTNDEVPEAYLTVRVPAEQNDAFVTELKGLGEVMQLESQDLDVTFEKVDLESRVSSLQSSIASLTSMLEQATNVEDMLAIEKELSARQAELQSLEAQLEVLSEDVAMSTVYVNLTSDAEPRPIDEPSGFFAGLVEGWNDFVESLNDFITGLGYALPGLLLLVVILALLWFFVVRPIWQRIRRRTARETEQATAAETPPARIEPEIRPDV